MTERRVSLNITTGSLTLSELSLRLGCLPSSSSHEKGDLRGHKAPFSQTIWRLDSNAPVDAALEQHIESLAAQLPPNKLSQPGVLSEDCVVYVTIGLFFGTAQGSLLISPRGVDIIKAYKAILEVNCYPCAGEEP